MAEAAAGIATPPCSISPEQRHAERVREGGQSSAGSDAVPGPMVLGGPLAGNGDGDEQEADQRTGDAGGGGIEALE